MYTNENKTDFRPKLGLFPNIDIRIFIKGIVHATQSIYQHIWIMQNYQSHHDIYCSSKLHGRSYQNCNNYSWRALWNRSEAFYLLEWQSWNSVQMSRLKNSELRSKNCQGKVLTQIYHTLYIHCIEAIIIFHLHWKQAQVGITIQFKAKTIIHKTLFGDHKAFQYYLRFGVR